MCRTNGASGQHDWVCGQIDGAIRSHTLDAGSGSTGYQHPPGPGVGQQGEIRAVHRGFHVRATRAHPGSAVHVQWHRADPFRQWLVTCATVEILTPAVSGFTSGTHERCCAAIEFGYTANENRSRRAVQRSVEVDIGFDRAKVWQHVGPGPARQSPAVEIRREAATEV